MSRTDRLLLVLCALGMATHLYLIFVMVPNEKTMGFVQRIFYFHVPLAWVSFLAFMFTAFKGIRYLASRDIEHDRVAAASAEVGLLCVTLVLITGPIWARPVWGIWWTWDLRLTTTLVLWLIFLAYSILRRSIGEPDRRAVLSAVVGLCGAASIPLVYMANRVKATQHPAPVVGGGEKSGLAGIFLFTLFFGFAVFTLLYVVMLRVRTTSARLEDEVEDLMIQRSAQERINA
jgi:heme exporter protein C